MAQQVRDRHVAVSFTATVHSRRNLARSLFLWFIRLIQLEEAFG